MKSEAEQPAEGPRLDPVLRDIAEARNYNDWLFDRARPYLGRRVLDAGAGIGTFVTRALDTGAEVVALEPDPDFVSHLLTRFAKSERVRVVRGNAESLPDGLEGFDSILCFNVLEHIADDAVAVANFRERLRQGG